MTGTRKLFLPALLLLFLSVGIYTAKNTSATVDEAIFHTVDGYVGLKTHDYRLNPVSPAFAREWVALPWLFLNPKLDLDSPSWKEADSPAFGTQFFYQDNRDKALCLLFSARLMNLLLGAALVAVVFFWCFELYGFFGAVIGSTLTALTPCILAHSAIAATDLPVMFWAVFFLFALWKWLRGAGAGWFILSIVTLGLTQSSKFTALFFYPVLGIILWKEKGFLRAAGYFALILLGSLLVVWATYFFEFKPLLLNVPRVGEKLVMIEGLASKISHGNTAAIAWLRNATLTIPIPLPSYILGIAGVARGHQAPYIHYFNGGWTTDVQWFYYIASFLVKMTPAFLIFLFLRAAVSFKTRAPQNLLLFTLLPAAVFFWITLKDSTAVGMRYLLVTVPLFSVWAAGLAVVPVNPEKGWKRILGVLLAMQLLSFATCFPYYLEYFNGIVDGAPNAYHYFRGSDIDWGQGLVYLKKYLKKNRVDQKIALEYFGSTDPAIYGINSRPLDPGENKIPRKEFYAVSVQHIDSVAWTATKRPTAKLGSIFIYDFREAAG